MLLFYKKFRNTIIFQGTRYHGGSCHSGSKSGDGYAEKDARRTVHGTT